MTYQEINFSGFCDAFNRFDTYKDTFTYNGKNALFEYLEQLSEDCDEKIELDIVALCCEYSEHDSALECAINYVQFEGMTFDADGAELKTVEQVDKEALEFLQNNTTVIEIDGSDSIIIQDF